MVGLSRKRVFPKTTGDSITGQDRAQKHCDFRFSQIEKNLKSQFCNYNQVWQKWTPSFKSMIIWNSSNAQVHIYPSLVLVRPRKSPPYITERLLMGRKESNKQKSTNTNQYVRDSLAANKFLKFLPLQPFLHPRQHPIIHHHRHHILSFYFNFQSTTYATFQ